MPWFQRDWDKDVLPYSPDESLETSMPWFQRDWDPRFCYIVMAKWYETSMPWFQRDWDLRWSAFQQKRDRKHRCPDFKGIETHRPPTPSHPPGETSMPWFQRDWDACAETKALHHQKHRCPDFKGIETTRLGTRFKYVLGNIDALISKGLRPILQTTLLPLLPETSMPWFQRDWDECKGVDTWRKVKHRCPDFKGIETYDLPQYLLVFSETSMPWFQRDWD